MGVIGRVYRSIRPRGDPTLTKKYWDSAASGSDDRAAIAICDGTGMRELEEFTATHFDPLLARGRIVMDLACGMGRTCRYVAREAKEYHGVDFIPDMIAKARRYNHGVPNAEFHVNDGATLSGFADGSFGLVYSEFAFQHMPSDVRGSYARESLRVLEDGGMFLAQLPRADVYKGSNSLTEGGARRLLSGFDSVEIEPSETYWCARATKAGRREDAAE